MSWSFFKLLILAIAVYWLWNWIKEQRQLRRQGRGPVPGVRAAAADPAPSAGPRKIDAVDLVKCPKCSAYVSVGAGRGCARADCPSV